MKGLAHNVVLKRPCARNTLFTELIREGRPAGKHLFGIEYSIQADAGAPRKKV
jgi:hypothetical protein